MINIYQRTAGKEDRSEIIIDEFIGQQIPLFFIEISTLNIILVFVFFRFFDIFKIFPSNYIDKNYKNSFGIIADDLIAGIQASALIFIVKFYNMSINLAKNFIYLCIKKNIYVNLAESCTGGLISSKIIEIADASKVLKYSIVTYSNDSKKKTF